MVSDPALAAFVTELAESAGFASTSANFYRGPDGELAVRAACERGRHAAQHGVTIPLPVLLDVWGILQAPRFAELSRTADNRLPLLNAYDEWLRDLCFQIRRFLERHPATHFLAEPPAWDCLPLVLDAWRPYTYQDESLKWADAYVLLGNKQIEIHRALNCWQKKNLLSDESQCAKWFPREFENVLFSERARQECAFSTGIRGVAGSTRQEREHGNIHFLLGLDRDLWPAERLDYPAARMYLEANDPPLLPDQEERLRQLRLRHQRLIFNPRTTSYEELSRYYGAIAMSTLCEGEYGVLKIVNRTDIRFSNPPPAIPPNPFHIHLCWANGSAGLTHENESVEFVKAGKERVGSTPASLDHPSHPVELRATEQERASGMTSESSMLQGFAALLLDDWRSALQRLPVRFHAHKGKPLENDVLGRGSKRWKDDIKKGAPMLPNVAARFFERRNWLDVGCRDLGWEATAGLAHWYCLCLLKCDLEEFGFTPSAASVYTQRGVWTAGVGALPGCISHVILLESRNGVGSIYQVVGGKHSHGNIELLPRPTRSKLSTQDDPSFTTLRMNALDIVLDVLGTRLR